jgi:hypothetical protein
MTQVYMKGIEVRVLERQLHPHVHCNTVHNSQEVEASEDLTEHLVCTSVRDVTVTQMVSALLLCWVLKRDNDISDSYLLPSHSKATASLEICLSLKGRSSFLHSPSKLRTALDKL